MKFQDLPVEVQVVAADTLHSLIHENRFNAEEKSVTQLAQEVRSAFVELYRQGGGRGKDQAGTSECRGSTWQELKHVIALLLEDAKRVQELEPNAGTEARIWIAKSVLVDSKNEQLNEVSVLVDEASERIINDIKNNISNGH